MSKTANSRHRSIRLLGMAGLAVLGTAAGALVPAISSSAVTSTGTNYYVSTSGSDQNSGTSTSSPWQSLAKVDATTFQPGDTVYFESGDTWVGQLWAKGSGSSSAPITIDSYGTGAKPQIQGQGTVGDAVQLFNQQYWVIRNLDVSNAAPVTSTPGANLGDFRGIGVHGDNGTVLHNITIDSVYVHDVTGQINWVGGSSSNDTPGVNWGMGWDRSKNTGGIIVNASVANIAAPGAPTTYDGLTIENSQVENTSFSGISTKQYSGDAPGAVATGWGQRTSATDSKFTPFTNVTIQNNYITQAGTAFGGDGVYITGVRGGIVQGNVIDQVGVSGVESNMTDNITVQYNEIMGTHYTQHSADANGLDPDIGTTNQYFQYNYLHDNADGILLCACGSPQFGSATVRYNVVANSTNRNIYFSQVSGSTAQVYNNTFYNKTAPNMTSGSIQGTVTMTNNIFASERSDTAFVSASALKYNNNGYTSNETKIPSSETKAVTVSDARFVNPDPTGPYGSADGTQLATADAYALQPGSGFIDAGATITNNGGRDFAGNAVPNGVTDIGAFEYRTPAGQNTESVTGTITNQYQKAVAGANVSVSVAGSTYTATSDSTGFYDVQGVPFASNATLTATATDYADFQTSVSIASGTFTRENFVMTSTSTTGTFTGEVVDERGTAVPGASVSLTENDVEVATATSGTDGRFTFPSVTAANDYSFTASALGYTGPSRGSFSVTPTATVDVGGLYLTSHATDSVVEETFDNLPTGALSDGTDGWRVVSTGNTVNVAEVPSSTDKSAYLNRTNSQGGTDGTNLARVFSSPLKGLVTVKAQIMRNDPSGGYYGAPYVYNANGTQAVSVAFARGQITAYVGGTSKTIAPYNLNQWYDVDVTIDTVNQTFDLDLNGNRVITDAAFRTSMPSIGKVAWYSNGGEIGSIYVNNVSVSQGSAYVPVSPLTESLAFSPAQPNGDNGWYTQPVAGTITTQGGSGGAQSQYAVDDGEMIPYTAPFSVDTDGEHLVSYQSSDTYQTTDVTSAAIKIDSTAPSTTGTFDAKTRTVTASAADSMSGVAEIQFSQDGGVWTEYTQPIQSDADAHTVDLRSVDEAGNISDVITLDEPEGTQSIDFAAIADRTFGDADFAVSAESSSGLPIAFSTSGPCTVTGVNVHILGAGTCTITASQDGNAAFRPAVPVSESLVINPAPTTVTAGDASAPWGTSAKVEAQVASPVTGAITGEVKLTEGTTDRGSVAVANGAALFVLPVGLSGGQHTLTLTYSGAEDFAGSTNTVIVTVVLPKTWDSTMSYQTGDRVSWNGAVYQAAWYSRNETPGKSATGAWQELAMTEDGTTIWTASRIFQAGNTVTYSGKAYLAAWYTRNEKPGLATGAWEEIATAPDGVALWTPSRIFNAGDVAEYNGVEYTARWYTRNQTPGSVDGPWARAT